MPSTDLLPVDVSPLSEVVINTASAADLALVAASAGLKARLFKLVLVAAGATTVTLKDGSTALTGAMSMVAGTPLILPFDSTAWATTSVNAILNLNNSGAVQISGRAYYTLKP